MVILYIVLALIVAVLLLGVCIFVHEFGHFLCAFWRGLYVERFSIGFGKKLWGFHYKGVEFVVSWFAFFGGYVALPQLEPTNEPKTENGEPLPQAAPVDRGLTAVAGPVFNVALGFLLATVLWITGIYKPAPMDSYEIINIKEESKGYEAGLRKGDKIVGINGSEVNQSWNQALEDIALTPEKVRFRVKRNNETLTVEYKPEPNPDLNNLPIPEFEIRKGVAVDRVTVASPAEKMGLRPKDRILEVNGQEVHSIAHTMKLVNESRGDPVSLKIMRDGKKINIESITPEKRKIGQQERYLIGVELGSPKVLVYLNPWEQFMDVIKRTTRTLNTVATPGSGVKVRHLSGPLGILDIFYQVVRYGGWRPAMSILILVTFSLAILNLLPVPVLDGGHLLFGALEGITGRKIPESVAYYIQVMFAVLLIGFMLYVSFFDLLRISDRMTPPEEKQDAKQEEPQNTQKKNVGGKNNGGEKQK